MMTATPLHRPLPGIGTHEVAPQDQESLNLLAEVVAAGLRLRASDIHLRAQKPPVIRVDGVLRPLAGFPVLTPEFLQRLATAVVPARMIKQFREQHHLDRSIGFPTVGRVRLNVFYQRGSIAMALRAIRSEIPTPAELGLPDVVTGLAGLERGLVLVTGATGSGKSTTLASLIELINGTRSAHILTIEDPIEFLFTDRKAIVTQREVGTDTSGFAEATRAALREDPDVILLGEMRDTETIEAAMTAAETGHLVFSTVHAPGAVETISRIVTSFESGAQAGIRAKLAQNLRAVVSQRLLPSKDGQGRVVACEVLTVSALAGECILEAGRVKELADLVRRGTVAEGMRSFDAALLEHCRAGNIDEAVALRHATSPTDLKLQLQGFA